MSINEILSYLSGYLNKTEFELDIVKVADIAEMSEDEFMDELQKLQSDGYINFDGSNVTLINIKPKTNKKFNELYAPVETMEWTEGMKVILDK